VASQRALDVLDALVWVLIYGGLLTFVLGLFTQKAQAVLGFWLTVGGACAVVVGVLLLFIRSQLRETP
jgi:hypothetical protein